MLQFMLWVVGATHQCKNVCQAKRGKKYRKFKQGPEILNFGEESKPEVGWPGPPGSATGNENTSVVP